VIPGYQNYLNLPHPKYYIGALTEKFSFFAVEESIVWFIFASGAKVSVRRWSLLEDLVAPLREFTYFSIPVLSLSISRA